MGVQNVERQTVNPLEATPAIRTKVFALHEFFPHSTALPTHT
jgi:hypothetical protein